MKCAASKGRHHMHFIAAYRSVNIARFMLDLASVAAFAHIGE
jgi:hypothetical protein